MTRGPAGAILRLTAEIDTRMKTAYTAHRRGAPGRRPGTMTAHLLDWGDLHAGEEPTQDGPSPGRPPQEAAEAQGPRGRLTGGPGARAGRRVARRPGPAPAGQDETLMAELVRAAGQLGVAVRVEPFATPLPGAGALCVLRGARLVLLDRRASARQRLLALARVLVPLGIDGVWLTPAARDLIEDAPDAPG